MDNGKLTMDNSQFSISTYPLMKDSGVEWIGEIPEGWEVKKSRYIFEIKKRIAGELGFDILSITQNGNKSKGY